MVDAMLKNITIKYLHSSFRFYQDGKSQRSLPKDHKCVLNLQFWAYLPQ